MKVPAEIIRARNRIFKRFREHEQLLARFLRSVRGGQQFPSPRVLKQHETMRLAPGTKTRCQRKLRSLLVPLSDWPSLPAARVFYFQLLFFFFNLRSDPIDSPHCSRLSPKPGKRKNARPSPPDFSLVSRNYFAFHDGVPNVPTGATIAPSERPCLIYFSASLFPLFVVLSTRTNLPFFVPVFLDLITGWMFLHITRTTFKKLSIFFIRCAYVLTMRAERQMMQYCITGKLSSPLCL